MPRPKVRRRLKFVPSVSYYKPLGVPLKHLEEVVLQHDEIEAIRLHDVDGLNQTSAAVKMGISQPTFARILDSAYKKIANALVKGKAIKIDVSPYH